MRGVFEQALHSTDPPLSQSVEDLAVSIVRMGDDYAIQIQSQTGGSLVARYSQDEIFNSLQTRLYPVAVEAHRIYSGRLDEVTQSLKAMFGTCGEVCSRAKSPISAANRLARTMFAPWSSEMKIVSAQDAIENLWDAIGARVVLRNGGDQEVEQAVSSIEDGILNGTLTIEKLTNLRGPHGIPYLSDDQVYRLRDADIAVKVRQGQVNPQPFKFENEDRREGSPFTSVCAYVKLGQGITGELQLLGPRVLELANAEHLPYDALIQKDLYRRLNAEGKEKMRPLFEPFLKAAQSLTPQQKKEYELYLNECYIQTRKIEKGIAVPGEAVPFPPTLKGLTELSVENILHLEHEYAQVLKEYKKR